MTSLRTTRLGHRMTAMQVRAQASRPAWGGGCVRGRDGQAHGLNDNRRMVTFSIRSAPHSVASSTASPWGVRLVTLAVWALLASSVVYWVLQWPQANTARGGSLTTLAEGDTPLAASSAASLSRALGAPAVVAERASAPALSSRLSLVGVVRAGARDGAALIAVDGKSPRSVRVGAEVEPGLYLLALEPRLARLGPDRQGTETVVLELPRPKVP